MEHKATYSLQALTKKVVSDNLHVTTAYNTEQMAT